VLVAIGVDQHKYRQVLGIKEDKERWIAFIRFLKNVA
jgi:hypothetical protein